MKNLIKFFTLIALFIAADNINSQSGWIQQSSGTTSNITGITFINYNTGFALASPILKTINGGQNWIPLPGNPVTSSMSWPDYNTGYLSNGTVYKTTDGGQNWTDLNQSYIGRISFPNSSTGYAICSPEFVPGPDITYYRVRKTGNGGINWNISLEFSTFNTALHSYGFYYVQAPTPEVAYVAVRYDNYEFHSYWSRVYRTQNGGGSWSYIMHSADTLVFKSFHFPSADTGYVIASLIQSTNDNFIYKYENNTWRHLLSTSLVRGIYFPNNNTGYMARGVNEMYKTTNGGNNWFAINSPGNNQINAFYFIDALTGYAVGSNGFIAKTTTGGVTPVLYSVSGTVKYQDNSLPVTSGYVKALRYDSLLFNIITVDSAQIQSNGTYTLSNIPPGITTDIMAYENDEEELSFVPTYYVSTINWQNATPVTVDSNMSNIDISVKRTVNSGSNLHVSGYVYTNNENDYTGLKDAVVYSRAAGVFKGHSISLSNGYYCIDSLPSGVYEIIADRMGYDPDTYIISLTTSSLDNVNFYLDNSLVPIKYNGSIVPDKMELSQNYPNPFNPKTKIKFSLPHPSKGEAWNVKLYIYDILGRQVASLIPPRQLAGGQEGLLPGTYEVEFDGSKLSSGLYFYVLNAGDFTESKKMVLIK